jgi:Kef-type K+ transport system membrane component KefB
VTSPLSTLLVIAFVAVLAPLATELPVRVRPPVVVLEVLLGVIVGPHVMGLIAGSPLIDFLSRLGLIFLFFLAGLEIDLNKVRGRPLYLASAGWLISLVVAESIAWALVPSGFVRAPSLVGSALTTTALGTLMPILRDAGELEGSFGRYILGAGAAGEFFPVLVVSILFSREPTNTAEPLVLVGFCLLAAGAAYATLHAKTPAVVKILSRGMRSSSQLPIRLCVLIMVALAALADRFGLDMALGAFAAGMVVGLAVRGHKEALLHEKLDALGFGFFIPMFFVISGARIDLPSLTSSTSAMLRVPFFLALLLVSRGVPVLLYKKELRIGDRIPFVLYSATALPLLVAITEIGTETGRMRADNAAALVAAGMLSLMIFPVVALTMHGSRRRRRESQTAEIATQS